MALYAIAMHFYDIVQTHAILTPATVKCMDGMLISPSLLCIKSDVTQHNFLKPLHTSGLSGSSTAELLNE